MLGPLVSSRRIAEAGNQNPRKPRHGKQGVCRGLPPVAGGPLPAKEGVESRTFGRLVRRAGGRTSHRCTLCDVCYSRAHVYLACTSDRRRVAPRRGSGESTLAHATAAVSWLTALRRR